MSEHIERVDEIVRDAVTTDVKAQSGRRVMVNRQVKVPEPYQDENADAWWAEGHVDPALFLLGCLWVTQRDCGGVSFVDWLHDRELLDSELNNVQHVWMRPLDPDFERGEFVESDADGAMAFTRLGLS